MNPSPFARRSLIFSGLLLASIFQAQGAFSIDFRNGIWNHSAVGGPAMSTGWGKTNLTNPNSLRGYTQGSTLLELGVTLTVKTQFFGTAIAGVENFTNDPSNTPGFAFQNTGSGDFNSNNVTSGKAVLVNYQRIDFSFSQKVSLTSLQIADIDTATSSGAQTWRDAVGLELWNGSVPTVPGSGILPTMTLNGTIAVPTRLTQDVTHNGLPYAYATTLGNTTTSANPIAPTNSSSATFSSQQPAGVDGFSIYLWNRGTSSTGGGKHGIVLQAAGNVLQVVPEPTTALLTLVSCLAFIGRRRR